MKIAIIHDFSENRTFPPKGANPPYAQGFGGVWGAFLVETVILVSFIKFSGFLNFVKLCVFSVYRVFGDDGRSKPCPPISLAPHKICVSLLGVAPGLDGPPRPSRASPRAAQIPRGLAGRRPEQRTVLRRPSRASPRAADCSSTALPGVAPSSGLLFDGAEIFSLSGNREAKSFFR